MTSSSAHEFWESALLGIVLCMIMNASPMMLMLMLMMLMIGKGYVTDAGPILMMNRESGMTHGSAA